MIHKYIIISKDKKDEANQFCNSIGAEGETFSTPLYTDTELSHFWTGWLMSPEQFKQIEAIDYMQIFSTYDQALSATSLRVTDKLFEEG